MPNEIVRLYRIFNIEVGKYGKPFGMCDAHCRAWEPGIRKLGNLIVEKVADDTNEFCNQCVGGFRSREQSMETFGATVAHRIVADLCDRRGLKWEWAKIDKDVQVEIKNRWAAIIVEELRQWLFERLPALRQ